MLLLQLCMKLFCWLNVVQYERIIAKWSRILNKKAIVLLKIHRNTIAVEATTKKYVL
ncbi:hypothetical protein SAMN06265379_10785 [Saccharicrinis carchari]|uniref:Uncharacterized protein n=1 Tax=Saccharicrinis carchari TaxID=1168039 RepID=A0A521E2G6_SACCC|nr:hypothetical protein SAMN06265379_10785 [Saccharicrinis carchari]